MTAHRVRVPAFGFAVLLLIACGSQESQTAAEESAPAWTVEGTPNLAQGNRPGPDGKPVPAPIVSDSLPSDFPVDVPQYPGAQVTQSRVSPGSGFSASFTVGDDVEKVASFYADGFAGHGWATDTKRSPEGTAVFAEKEKRSASALVSPGGDRTLVNLIVVDR
jgi:hypothetical protein